MDNRLAISRNLDSLNRPRIDLILGDEVSREIKVLEGVPGMGPPATPKGCYLAGRISVTAHSHLLSPSYVNVVNAEALAE